MLLQVAVVLGLAVASTSASAQRGQRHQRQAPPYGGGNSTTTSSTSTISTSSSTSSSSSSTPLGPYTPSNSTSSSSYGSSTSSTSSTSSSLSLSSTSSSSSASPVTLSPSVSSPSATYGYSTSSPESSVSPIYGSSAAANSTSSRQASPYSSVISFTISSTISTYVTVSTSVSSSYSPTFYSYSPPTNSSASSPTTAPYSSEVLSSTYSRSSGTGPSYYAPPPVGPHTASSSSPAASYGSAGGSAPASENSTALAGTGPSYYAPSRVGPETANKTSTHAPYGSAGSSIVPPYNTTFPYLPYGTASGQKPLHTYQPPASCYGATLNVLNASLDWWYTSTFTYVASTFSVSTNLNGSTGWSIIPASTTFDVTSALATPSCTYIITESVGWQGTYSYYEGTCFRTPTPVAASTTVVSVSAYKPLNQTTGNGAIPNVVTPPPIASVTIPVANSTANTTSAGAFSAGTPFVYFSSYEIVRKRNTTDAYGRADCAEATTTHHMTEPFSFEYQGPNVNGLRKVGANVTGDVNPAFLGVVAQDTAKAGSWVAAPTVVMVVEKVLARQGAQVPFAASASALETITPTLPPGFTSAPAGSLSSIGFTARVASSQPILLLPTTTASNGGGGAAQNTPTTAAGGGVSGGGATTAGSGGGNNGGSNAGSGGASAAPGLGGLISAVDSAAAQPTNALEVLTQAQSDAGNPTASAIVAGLGGSNSEGGGGGQPAAGDSGSSNSGGSGGSSGGSSNSGGSGSGSGGTSGGGNQNSGSSGSGSSGGSGGSSGPGGSGGSSGSGSSGGSSGSGSSVSGSRSQTVTVGGSTFTVTPSNNGGSSGVVVAAGGSTATLAPGQTANVGGQTVSAPSSGGVVIGTGSGATTVSPGSLSSGSGSSGGDGSSGSSSGGGSFGSNSGSSGQGGAAPAQIITVAGSTATANPAPAFVVHGQTVLPGGSITVGSDTIAIPATPTAIIVDGSTLPIAGSIASSTVFDVNGIPITAKPEPAFPIAGQTLQAGGSPITVDGTTLSLVPGGTAVVVDGSTSLISQQSAGAAANIPLLTIGSLTLTANAATQFSLAPGETLTPGGVVTVSGTVISLTPGASAVVINGKTENLAAPAITPAPLVTVGGTVYQPNTGSTYDIGGQILTPGGVVTVSGTVISLAPGASAVVINGKTENLAAPAITPAPLVTVGGTVYQPNAGSTYDIGGQILTPGGVVTVSGTVISLAPGASAVVINGKTENLAAPAITPAPLVTVGGTVYQPNAGSTYDIGGQILTPGGVITVSGTVISLAPGASAIVINGVTTTLTGSGSQTAPNSNYATITAPPVLTVDGQGFAANGGTSYVISGKTLTPGGEITISGPNGIETISLNSAANELFSIVSGTTMTSMVGAMGAMSTGAPVLTLNGQFYTAFSYDTGAGPTYVIDGQTLTRGGEITITAPSGGKETISLDSAGTAIDIIFQGHTTVSTISGAYGVMPTSAPILTIDGETFTAINNGATYVIDGKTLTPGETETVTISGHTFIISLAPQATLLMIETEGADGKVTGTTFETLFPAQMTRGTVTNTVGMPTAGASVGAAGASTTGGGGGDSAGFQGGGSLLSLRLSAVAMAIGSLALAIWL